MTVERDPAGGRRAEIELLLACARTRLDAETVGRVRRLLAQGIDWAYFHRVADRHNVSPLVSWQLADAPAGLIPARAGADLRACMLDNARRNLILTADLLKLLDLLRADGISAVPFKGPVLAAAAYGNLALRRFSDLDILVREADVPRTHRLLVAHGFAPQYDLSPAQAAVLTRTDCECVYWGSDERLVVDLHWGFSNIHFPFRLDPAAVWSRLGRVWLGGHAVPSLMPEDLFLVLCVHGTKHLWERLAWLCDLAELIRSHPELDWRRLAERADALGAQRMLRLGLALAHDLLEDPLPESVRRWLEADAVVGRLATQVAGWLGREEAPALDPFEAGVFHLRARERLRDRIEYTLRYLTAPTLSERFQLPLPASLAFLHPLLRPIRLTREYAPRLLHRLR